MKAKQSGQNKSTHPDGYVIEVASHLGGRWQEWFEDLTVTPTEDGNTMLHGPVQDQAALHGILSKIRDLGLKLISVNPYRISEES